ncbi:MAG: AMP-binding protein [Stackebrandtia sp.]
MPGVAPSPDRPAVRAFSRAGAAAHVGLTMARRGLLTPGRPDRVARQLRHLARWGLSLAGGFGSAARRDPHAVALVDEGGETDFAELDARTDRLASGLGGLLPPDRTCVGVLCRNHAALVETLIACAKLGADAVLLNTGLSAGQVLRAAADHDLAVLVADAEFVPVLGEAADSAPRTSIVTAWPAEAADAVLDGPTLERLVRTSPAAARRPPRRSGRTIVLTSGATGDPKGALRPAPRLRAMTAVLSRIPLRVKDRAMIAAPIFHTWGYAALQLSMAVRAAVVLPRRFEPETVLRQLAQARCTALFAVPVMLQRILDLPEYVRRRHDVSALRVVAVSGSRLPGDLAVRFMDAFGDVLYNLYGTTEVSWASIAVPAELRRSPDTAGRPPYGTSVTLLDAAGRPVADQRTGRIFVRNDMLFGGYTDGGDRDMRDGAMDTGDLGRRDASGLLFVDGRADDMIVSGGENVFPKQVEDVLCDLAQVNEVAVVGVPDDEFGQRLAAYVVTRPGARLDAEQVRGHVRRSAARFCVPRDVYFVSALPRNATGKVVARWLTPPGRDERA